MGYYWADDAVIMGPGLPPLEGKKQIIKMLSRIPRIPGFKITWNKEPSSFTITNKGQLAYLFARNEITVIESTGTFQSNGFNQALQIWKKDGEGNWRVSVSVMYPEIPKMILQEQMISNFALTLKLKHVV